MPLIFIPEMSTSNLDQDIGNNDRDFCDFSLHLQKNPSRVLSIGHDPFFHIVPISVIQ